VARNSRPRIEHAPPLRPHQRAAERGYAADVSEANVAIVRAIFETGATTSKQEILKALPEAIPALFRSDAEWIEAPERVDSTSHRGHDGIRDSFERWLEQWDDYRFESERFEDHGDHILVVSRESGEGRGSGASTEATLFSVFSFRDGKIGRYQEFYDEAAARAALG
jgi:ketosteroid isomerase-like protein